MDVVAPYLPEVRASGPMEDVQSITLGEHLRPVTVDGDSVVGAHVVAELIRVEVRCPFSYKVVGGHVSCRAARKRSEVGVDLIGEVTSTPLPIFRIDCVIYLVHDEGNLRPIRDMLDQGLYMLIQFSPR